MESLKPNFNRLFWICSGKQLIQIKCLSPTIQFLFEKNKQNIITDQEKEGEPMAPSNKKNLKNFWSSLLEQNIKHPTSYDWQ